jgi:type III secretion system FlhB-like substrate exporter
MDRTEIKRAATMTQSAIREFFPVYSALNKDNQIDKLIQSALESKTPYYQNPELMRQLSKLDFSGEPNESMDIILNEILNFIAKTEIEG